MSVTVPLGVLFALFSSAGSTVLLYDGVLNHLGVHDAMSSDEGESAVVVYSHVMTFSR